VLRIVDGQGPGEDHTVSTVTARLFGEEHTDTQRRSVARAVATLQARGLVETWRGARRFRTVDAGMRTVLVNFWEGEDREPTTTRGRYLRALGLREGTYPVTRTVPVPETFVYRRRGGLPPEVIAADESRRQV
jgi:hypothetical protein